MSPDGMMDRRGFITACACGGAGMLLAGCVSMVTHPVPVSAGRVELELAAYPDLSRPDGAIKIQPLTQEDPIYVLNTNEGYRALSPICTHRGCTVDVSGERLVCPCHGSTYNREGEVLKGPAQRALGRFPVTRRGDRLIIEVGVQR